MAPCTARRPTTGAPPTRWHAAPHSERGARVLARGAHHESERAACEQPRGLRVRDAHLACADFRVLILLISVLTLLTLVRCALCCDGRVVSIALGTHPKTSRSARTAPRSTGTRFGRSALRSGAAHCASPSARKGLLLGSTNDTRPAPPACSTAPERPKMDVCLSQRGPWALGPRTAPRVAILPGEVAITARK